MPRFDSTGPMGMGPMTGGGRGMCHPYSGPIGRRGLDPGVGWGRGRGGGHRHMFWETGQPGWLRSGSAGPWGWNAPSPAPYTREQEMAFLKDRAAALKDELSAIDGRLQDLDSEAETTE